MKSKIKGLTFFIEILIAICFLGIFGAILSQIFVNSYNQSVKSKELIWATNQTISIIEIIKSHDYDEFIISDSVYDIYYDKDLKICDIENSIYNLHIETKKDEKYFGAFIEYEIDVKKGDYLITNISSGQYKQS